MFCILLLPVMHSSVSPRHFSPSHQIYICIDVCMFSLNTQCMHLADHYLYNSNFTIPCQYGCHTSNN